MCHLDHLCFMHEMLFPLLSCHIDTLTPCHNVMICTCRSLLTRFLCVVGDLTGSPRFLCAGSV